jgi:hypothetical protein
MTKQESTKLTRAQGMLDGMSAPMLAAMAKDALSRLVGMRALREDGIPYETLDGLTDLDDDLR